MERAEGETSRIWEARKRNVQLLYQNIKEELDVLNWIIRHPRKPQESVSVSDFITEQEEKISEYYTEEVAKDTVEVVKLIVRKFSDVVTPKVLEPFRQSLQIFKEGEMRIGELKTENRKLRDDFEEMKKKFGELEQQYNHLKENNNNKVGEEILVKSTLSQEQEPVLKQLEEPQFIPETHRSEMEEWKEEFIRTVIDPRRENFTSRKKISGTIIPRIGKIKRSGEDLWKVNILKKLKEDLLKEYGF